MIIAITGIDGTGKTTLAKGLVRMLTNDGIRATYVYGRTKPTFSRLGMAMGRTLFFRRHDIWLDYDKYEARKRVVFSRPTLAIGYAATILLDYYWQIWLKLASRVARYEVIVADRYTYDAVISDVGAHMDLSRKLIDRAVSTSLRFVPTPRLTLLLDAPAVVAFDRKDDVPHIRFLERRRDKYRRLVTRPEVRRLDATLPPDDVLRDAKRLVLEAMARA